MTKYTAFQELMRQESLPHREAVANHLRIQQQVGQKAETVVNHEGYTVFLAHLETVRSHLEQRRSALEAKMRTGPEVGDALSALKFELRDLDGEIRGLTTAIEMIPNLVERGKDAVIALSASGA